jgi:hypothetical protein
VKMSQQTLVESQISLNNLLGMAMPIYEEKW